MSDLEKISYETSSILGAQAKLLEEIDIPEALPGLTRFVTTFRGAVPPGLLTMITGEGEQVKVFTVHRGQYQDEYRIEVPNGQLARINSLGRNVPVLLTENEGLALVEDIGQLLLQSIE